MLPEIVQSLWSLGDRFVQNIRITASRINSRNASVYWESQRNIDLVHTFLKRRHDVEGDNEAELVHWLDRFERSREEAALDFWFEILKGVHESLREF
jgi:glyceraldehyde-3-phosphate dehydrogenase (ferredoxin)